MFSILAVFRRACLLVALFFPFSALDKILNFEQAIGQAAEPRLPAPWRRLLILAGLGVEISCRSAILTGVADRLAAFMLAGYCVVTALLWKQFWKAPDFRLRGTAEGARLSGIF